MRYAIEVRINNQPNVVFDAIHQYKVRRSPADLFGDVLPPKVVKIDFNVLTRNTLGLGAIYAWEFRVFGVPILKFCEQVVEWEEGKSVGYRALSGWEMSFYTNLKPMPGGTLVKTVIDFSPFGFAFLNWLFTPVVKWGLSRVYKRLEKMLSEITA